MSAFQYSRQRFLETYYYGKDQESVYLDLGKRLGTALQFRDKKEIKVIESIRQQIPIAPVYEHELKSVFKKIPLLSYFDGWHPEEWALDEYKTGKKPSEATWKKQMLFYSVSLFAQHKKLPKKVTLYWCRTYFDENEQLRLSGEVKQYNIKITMSEVLLFAGEMVKTYEDIKKLCWEEYQKFGVLPTQRSGERNTIKK